MGSEVGMFEDCNSAASKTLGEALNALCSVVKAASGNFSHTCIHPIVGTQEDTHQKLE